MALGQAHAHRELGGGRHMEDEAPVRSTRMKAAIGEGMEQPSSSAVIGPRGKAS